MILNKVKAVTMSSLILAMGIGTGIMGAGVTVVYAGSGNSGEVLDAPLTRRPAGSISGDKVSTVEANCPTDPSGNAWQGATGEIEISQSGSSSTVEIEIEDAVPNTVFTVWLRMKGGTFGGSPLTGGGATPLAPGSALDDLINYSPFGAFPGGSATLANAFTTDADGEGKFEIDLDFPVIRGAYPFQMATLPTPTGTPGIPTAVVNPADGHGGPFMIRVISHCTDQVGHGLSPGIREAWFQYP